MKRPPLGDQELEILRFVADNAPISVGDVAGRYAESHKLARTTVLTVMERLRKKGYLTRLKDGGVYRYRPQTEPADLLRHIVQEFVETRLAGSITPFVAYLAEADDLSEEELAALRRIVDRLPDRGVDQP